jgi:hypothetical protein
MTMMPISMFDIWMLSAGILFLLWLCIDQAWMQTARGSVPCPTDIYLRTIG